MLYDNQRAINIFKKIFVKSDFKQPEVMSSKFLYKTILSAIIMTDFRKSSVMFFNNEKSTILIMKMNPPEDIVIVF